MPKHTTTTKIVHPDGTSVTVATVTGPSTVPTRPLFQDGPEVSVIGFGAWPIGGGLGAVDSDVALRAVQVAVDVGQTFIDTAEYYERAPEYGNKTNKQGGSETVIGRALAAAPSLKEKAFVTTKCTLQPYTEEKIRDACAYSSEKLQTDCIELYQLHGWDPKTPIADQLGVLAALQQEGKIKYIGLNNAGVKQLNEAWATGIRFHTLQVRYHMFSRKEIETEIAPWCRAHGVGILAHSVLGKGLLTGKYKRGHVFPEDDERSGFFDFQGERFNQYCDAVEKLTVIATRKGHTMTELAVGWVLREPAVSVALVGAKSEAQVLANCNYVESFTEEELAEIETILASAPHVNWTITNGGNEAGGGGANWKSGMPEF